MARTTGPVCRLCRRDGLKLFLKGTRCDTPKCAIERRETPPGMATRRGKLTDYGIHLREKQKVKHYYGVLERQFRGYYQRAVKGKGNTGEALMSLLERRLDNIICRLGFGLSRCPGAAVDLPRSHYGQRSPLRYSQLPRACWRCDSREESRQELASGAGMFGGISSRCARFPLAHRRSDSRRASQSAADGRRRFVERHPGELDRRVVLKIRVGVDEVWCPASQTTQTPDQLVTQSPKSGGIMHIRWRGLELPSQVVCDVKTLSGTYGKFVAEPFERGFGVTIGNSLRRILLSSLEGSAVTQIKIHGAQHEFTTLPGVVEDMTDVVLNVKSLVVKNYTDQTKVLRIEKNTRGVVTGADVQTDETVEIINKNHVIATLTDDVPFVMEMVVENGRGYVPATEHSPNVQEIGIIPVDAVYSPVIRVRYEIEETRVGQKTNYDKLTLEIWTNGSIGPEMALVESAKILRKHLNPVRPIHGTGRSRRRCWSPGRAGRHGSGHRAKAEHDAGGPEAFGPGLELPGKRKHSNRARPGPAIRRSIAGSPQLRRNDAARSERKAGRNGPAAWHASSRGGVVLKP